MRTKLSVFTFLVCAILLAPFACRSNQVMIGREFSIHIGESASIQGEELQIKFLDVTEDSRCPRDAICVWEGRVTCVAEIIYRKSSNRIELSEPGLNSQPLEFIFKEYKISYHVEPYPHTGSEIADSQYILYLKISK